LPLLAVSKQPILLKEDLELNFRSKSLLLKINLRWLTTTKLFISWNSSLDASLLHVDLPLADCDGVATRLSPSIYGKSKVLSFW
jgi:hypothetical protein